MCPEPARSQQSNEYVRSIDSRENLRSAIRYSLRAEVLVNWTGINGLVHQARGYTRDLSPGGAYIFAREFPPVGQAVRVSIHLPMFNGESREPCVTLSGHVLRVDKPPLAAESGFSIRSESVTVCAA